MVALASAAAALRLCTVYLGAAHIEKDGPRAKRSIVRYLTEREIYEDVSKKEDE